MTPARTLLVLAVSAVSAVLSAGCASGWYAMQAKFAGDGSPSRDARIDEVSQQISAAVAADDLEKGIPLTKALWELSFGTNCNACRGRAYAALAEMKDAMLAVSKTRPAFESAMLLKVASEEQFFPAGMGSAEDGLAQFRDELKAELKKVEAKAKPELVERAASLEKAGHTASATLVLAQLVSLYPDDKDALARRDALRAKVKEQNLFRFAAKGHVEAASALSSAKFPPALAIAADAAKAFAEVELAVGQPIAATVATDEKQSGRVKQGTKSVPNSDYVSKQKQIEKAQEEISDRQAELGRMRSSKSAAQNAGNIRNKENSLEDWREKLAKYQKELAKIPPTEQVDNMVDTPYPTKVQTVTVRRDLTTVVRAGGKELAKASSVASHSMRAVSHNGLPAAKIAPLNEPVPSSSTVDAGTMSDAVSRAQQTVVAAYRAHLAEVSTSLAARGGEHATEAAALAVVLDPSNPSAEHVKAARAGLRVSDPVKLLAAN